jgi:hypothetical protein
MVDRALLDESRMRRAGRVANARVGEEMPSTEFNALVRHIDKRHASISKVVQVYL